MISENPGRPNAYCHAPCQVFAQKYHMWAYGPIIVDSMWYIIVGISFDAMCDDDDPTAFRFIGDEKTPKTKRIQFTGIVMKMMMGHIQMECISNNLWRKFGCFWWFNIAQWRRKRDTWNSEAHQYNYRAIHANCTNHFFQHPKCDENAFGLILKLWPKWANVSEVLQKFIKCEKKYSSRIFDRVVIKTQLFLEFTRRNVNECLAPRECFGIVWIRNVIPFDRLFCQYLWS